MAATARKPGWWYPYIFVAGMAVVILVNGIMITFALDTWTGLETEDHYNKGIKYNEAIAGARRQAELGWVMTSAFVAGPDRKGEIQVHFHGPDGKPIDGLEVEGMLIRPTHEGYDTEVELTARGNGLYAGPAAVALPGQWALRVEARRGDDVYQDEHRIQVP